MSGSEAAPRRAGSFLFLVWDGGGNVPPVLSLGHRLVSRGHRVRVLAPAALEARILGAGLEARPFVVGRGRDPGGGRAFEDQDPLFLGELFFGLPVAQDLAAEIERERPDVVVVDCMLAGGLAAAEASAVPTVAIVHTLVSFLEPLNDMWSMALVLLNPTRAELGAAPLDPEAGPLISQVLDRCALVLATTARALEPSSSQLGANVRFIGVQPDPPTADDAVPRGLRRGDPLVLVSLSTTYQKQEAVLAAILDALGRLPVQAVVTLGHELDPEELPPPPPNCIVRRWVPHAALLPDARVVVTHAGHGTVFTALSQGVPLVCMPMGRDQHVNAQRVDEAGCGRVLSATAGPDEIADAVRDVLTAPGYREAASRMAAAIRQELGDADPVGDLERLLGERAPAAG